MARSDEAEAFYFAVYYAVQEIPFGKVTSYGHIATLIGTPQRPRQVGVCLKHLPAEGIIVNGKLPRLHSGNVPWHRVISSKGDISPRAEAGGRQRQADLLRAEGIDVQSRAMGELKVDIGRFGWFPSRLPSEDQVEEEVDNNIDGEQDRQET